MTQEKTRCEAGFLNWKYSAILSTSAVSATLLVLAAFFEALFAKLLELINLTIRKHRFRLPVMFVLHLMHLGFHTRHVINCPHDIRLNGIITLQGVKLHLCFLDISFQVDTLKLELNHHLFELGLLVIGQIDFIANRKQVADTHTLSAMPLATRMSLEIVTGGIKTVTTTTWSPLLAILLGHCQSRHKQCQR
jgi:hypothetical protein